MGTILTVHGTFAHIEIPGDSGESSSSTAYWWRPDSPFVGELKELVKGSDGATDVVPFVWSGNNSERDRRQAGHQLFLELQRLEDEGQPYVIVAHSHGGSVVSAALLEAAAKKKKLEGLQRWITIGTPFIELRLEPFLFTRLPLILKAMYVASFMLFLIFIGATIGRFFEGAINFENSRQLWRLGISGIFAVLPVVAFYVFVTLRERRQRFFYRKKVRERAQTLFGDRWLALTHEDDEVVRGLSTLRAAELPIFDKQFAAPLLSFLAVFMLPMVYVYAIYSPQLMTGLSETLRTGVYKMDQLDTRAQEYKKARRKLRSLFRDIRDARKIADDTIRPLHEREAAKKVIRERRAGLRKERELLHSAFPNLTQLRRALRFRRKFLEKDGKLCNSGKLCGDGKSRGLNAQLLLHLITDEVASLFVDDAVRRDTVGRYARYLVPVILVPIVFGAVAILWVMIVQAIARAFSGWASGWLDRVTWKQIRRTALGNDTEDEVALGVASYPSWMKTGPQFLPMVVSSDITQCANDATLRSIGKFRDAISELAFVEAGKNVTDSVLAYFNWNELIHTSYFGVPSFTRLVAAAIAQSDGFQQAGDLTDAASREQADNWLSELRASRKTET